MLFLQAVALVLPPTAALPLHAQALVEARQVLRAVAPGRVRRQAQKVEAATLCEAALAGLRARARALPQAAEFSATCSEGLLPVEVGSGTLEARAREEGIELLDGRRQVMVDLLVDAQIERSVRVPVEVSLQVPQWCAAEPVASGEPVAAQRFAACRSPVRQPQQLQAAGRPLPAGRVKRALRAGDLLRAENLAGPGMQLRGDAVTVLLRSGAVVIESRGELGQDARIGDTVRVQLPQGRSVEGRLAAAQRVEVEAQP